MRLELTCEDRVGISSEILDCFYARDINLSAIEIQQPDRVYIKFPNLELSDLQTLMSTLHMIPGVEAVKTVSHLPSELEHQEIQALVANLPDMVFSVDIKGKITLVNTPAETLLQASEDELKGRCISRYITGFSIADWLQGGDVSAQTHKLTLLNEDYLGDILPIRVDNEGQYELVGAVIILESVNRIGKQFNSLRTFQFAAFDEIHAVSDKMAQLVGAAKKLAMLDAPLLIQGETGVGKELIARACHKISGRCHKPFLALNCAAMPDDVAESELFGIVTKSGETKRGIFELANEGSVLLDEIGDMSPYLQTKFLRLLETGTFRRVGDEQEVRVDVRIYCTTQKDLAKLIAAGTFRQDLYYRLSVLSMVVPPLRDRKDDIVPLCHSFCSVFSHELQRRKPQMSRSVLDLVQSYPWPGNVRQLRNVLYHALTLLDGDSLKPEHLQLPPTEPDNAPEALFEGSLEQACKRFEKLFLQRLYPTYPSTRQLAKRVGISHTAVANKLREYQITNKFSNK